MRIESRSGALAVICLVFFGIGVPATVIGPALPELAAKTGSSLADLGALFTSLFLGALITQATSGFLIDRIGERPIVAVGIAVASVGILRMGLAPSLTVVLVRAWLLGAGNAAVLADANVDLSRILAGRSL
jgi:MFS family permease